MRLANAVSVGRRMIASLLSGSEWMANGMKQFPTRHCTKIAAVRELFEEEKYRPGRCCRRSAAAYPGTPCDHPGRLACRGNLPATFHRLWPFGNRDPCPR